MACNVHILQKKQPGTCVKRGLSWRIYGQEGANKTEPS
uniref:Uncharacterized protein n=1 Tax=Arundo donax TaxID=35708 RepID=A0A0A9HHX5_ARUDO